MSGQVESPSKLMQKLIESGYPTPEGGFVGCSDADIAALESHFSVSLPEAYKEFLRVCGRDAGQFLSYCLYQAQALIDWVPSILSGISYVQFKLPPKHFVFIEDNDLVLYFDTTAEMIHRCGVTTMSRIKLIEFSTAFLCG